MLPGDYDPKIHFEKMKVNFKAVADGFSYSSNKNDLFLSKEKLRLLIKDHVDNKFKPI